MSETGSEIPTVDAKDYLKSPAKRSEVKALTTPPDLSLLQTLPNLPVEVGMALFPAGWYMITGDEGQIPLRLISDGAQVALHSHPVTDNTGPEEDAMPSTRDFLNAQLDTRNLVVSTLGITEYAPPQDYSGQRQLKGAVEAFIPMFTRKEERAEYERFLGEIGAKHKVHSWKEITPAKLAELLEPLT
jgi:hypothetical protein